MTIANECVLAWNGECKVGDYPAHWREYEKLEETVGYWAAEAFANRHMMRCANCEEPLRPTDEQAEVVDSGRTEEPVSTHLQVHVSCIREGQVMA